MKAIEDNSLIVSKWMDAEKWHSVSENLSSNKKDRKGHYRLIKVITNEDESTVSAIIHCPYCGTPAPLSKGHNIRQINPIDIYPSINNKQCCGWHGWLKNGEFIPV